MKSTMSTDGQTRISFRIEYRFTALEMATFAVASEAQFGLQIPTTNPDFQNKSSSWSITQLSRSAFMGLVKNYLYDHGEQSADYYIEDNDLNDAVLSRSAFMGLVKNYLSRHLLRTKDRRTLYVAFD